MMIFQWTIDKVLSKSKTQTSRIWKDTYDISGWELKMGEVCELGSQLRPHVVWFGEPVPMIEYAQEICRQAEIFIVIGTSLKVYPAAGLIDFVPGEAFKYLVDKNYPEITLKNTEAIINSSTIGVPELVDRLLIT